MTDQKMTGAANGGFHFGPEGITAAEPAGIYPGVKTMGFKGFPQLSDDGVILGGVGNEDVGLAVLVWHGISPREWGSVPFSLIRHKQEKSASFRKACALCIAMAS
jgi:hypothetical protein